MEAGRELDAVVWLAMNDRSIEHGTFGCRYVDGDVQPHAGYPVGHISPPRYSTDITAAWEIILKFRGRGFITVSEYHNGRVQCYFCTGPHSSVIVSAESAPLAICRALLLHVQAIKGAEGGA